VKSFWRGLLFVGVFLLAMLGSGTPARADGPDLNGVSFEQKLNAQVPLNLTFRNERNQVISLGDYFGTRPVILTLNYLRCANLCPLELQDLTETLSQLTFNLGDEYDVLTLSIDPRDTPIIAATKRDLSLGMYGRPGADAGWHFLTGNTDSIAQLAHTVGFNFVYDATQDDYSHPLGIIVLTPQGQVSRYLYGLDFPARDLRLALVEASQNKIATPVDQVLLFCYHYDPTAGRYTAAAMNFVKLGGLLGLSALGGFLFVLWRVELTKRKN
jgi:protein SCO1/2